MSGYVYIYNWIRIYIYLVLRILVYIYYSLRQKAFKPKEFTNLYKAQVWLLYCTIYDESTYISKPSEMDIGEKGFWSVEDPTETFCEKCNFGENRTHNPANPVRRSTNLATKTVAENMYIWLMV